MDFKERVKRRCEFDASLVYGVKEFNLLTGRDKHLAYRGKYDDQWIDKRTGIIDKQLSQLRNCPLCGFDKSEVLFVKSGFPHCRCGQCSLVYVNPILDEREYKKIFNSEDSWEAVLESSEQVKMQSLEAGYSLDIASLYIRNNNRNISVCDIGCGPGTLLNQAKKRGYDVFGIESNVRCHSLLAKNKIDFVGDFFPLKRDINRKFDCIFMLNVLEHLREPLKILLEVRKLILSGGIIYISVPSIDALVNRIMHEKAGVFGGHSHLQFFSIKTLAAFLEASGFEMLEYETIITEIGVINNFLSFEDPYFGNASGVFDFLTPELILKNHLARNINMVGRFKEK